MTAGAGFMVKEDKSIVIFLLQHRNIKIINKEKKIRFNLALFESEETTATS